MTETDKLREEWEGRLMNLCVGSGTEESVSYIVDEILNTIQKARDDLLDEIERRITNIIADEGLDISSRRVLELIEKLRSTVGKEGKA